MTHNDLLEATKSPTYMKSRTLEHPYIVLRAVLELHKPQSSSFDDTECATCSNQELSVVYPCATIQAIEKELV